MERMKSSPGPGEAAEAAVFLLVAVSTVFLRVVSFDGAGGASAVRTAETR
jgi:hypothetical protein